jgi:hypothetical protein
MSSDRLTATALTLIACLTVLAAGCTERHRETPHTGRRRPVDGTTKKPSPATQPTRRLSFCASEGASENCLLSEGGSSVHVVATSGKGGRLVIASPAANSGAALWLSAPAGESVALRISAPPRTVGGAVRLRVETRTPLKLAKVLLGSIRAIRRFHHRRKESDVPERAAALLEKDKELRRRAAAAGLTPQELRRRGRTTLEVEQPGHPMKLVARTTALDGKNRLGLRLTAREGRWLAGRREVTGTEFPLELELELSTSYRSARTRRAAAILRPDALALLGKQGYGPDSKTLRSLEFLATDHKYLAGSWRFLTYFGRDTLMTVWLMLPVLRPESVEIGLQSVLERVSPDGQVAHEESLGDQAALERLERFLELARQRQLDEAAAELRRLAEPVHDYKMVDDDFMLPCVLAAFLDQQQVTSARARRFLARQGNLQAVARNLAFVIEKARSRDALVSLLPGAPTGDWRDSHEGLGDGRYPASVNLYLVPAAINAVSRLLNHPKLKEDRTALRAALQKLGAAAPPTASKHERPLRRELRRLEACWRKAGSRFRIQLTPAQLRRRLKRYLRRGVRSDLERRLLRETKLDTRITVADFIAGKVPAALAGGLVFDALSLDARRRPVEVMHSDDSFSLLAMDLGVEELKPLLVKYELPFPVGLKSPGGIYVASPALSRRPADAATFDRGHYHGTVVWSWQLGMLQLGLIRQYRRLRRIDSPPAREMTLRLRTLLQELAMMKQNVGTLRDTELWTVIPTKEGFRPAAYGHAAGQTTESNVLQLWSVVHLAVDHAYARLGL